MKTLTKRIDNLARTNCTYREKIVHLVVRGERDGGSLPLGFSCSGAKNSKPPMKKKMAYSEDFGEAVVTRIASIGVVINSNQQG